MADQGADVTELLGAIGEGNAAASDALLPLVYEELRRLAHARMRKEGPQTLQPTALVHEAYLRLVRGEPSWNSRGHFFAAAAEAMRRILIERARRVGRPRHGGAQQLLDIDADQLAAEERGTDVLALDEALRTLEARDARMASVVKLRYFVGLSLQETAQALAVDQRTVGRDWLAAKTWLYRELSRLESEGDGSVSK